MTPLAVLRAHFTGECACSVSGISASESFHRFRVDERKRFKNVECERVFFCKQRKKSFSNNKPLRVAFQHEIQKEIEY